jgi:FPC/CPF motif-containing protein YcgG
MGFFMSDYGRLFRFGVGRDAPLASFDGNKPGRLAKHLGALQRGFSAQHPCIGARSVAVNGNLFVSIYPDMTSVASAVTALLNLEEYLRISDEIEDHVKTLALVFNEPIRDNDDFAQKYWAFVQRMHDLDCQTNQYDPTVSPDPNSTNFELSLGGRAIFTTTLNPGHSRTARHAPYPTWVCNQTRQFNRLRELGLFEKWQTQIRTADADMDPSGIPNPILADHGYSSAADQLAGVAVQPCPFKPRLSKEDIHQAGQALLTGAIKENCPGQLVDVIKKRVRVDGFKS